MMKVWSTRFLTRRSGHVCFCVAIEFTYHLFNLGVMIFELIYYVTSLRIASITLFACFVFSEKKKK